MDVKTKRRRRVTILLLILLVTAGVVTGVAFFAHWRSQRQAAQARQAGIAAYKQGHYAQAVKRLQPYLRQADADALYAYAESRLQVPSPSNRHIARAAAALARAVKKAPDNLAAAHDLLELRSHYGQPDKTLDLAHQILKTHPKDVQALAARAVTLTRQNRPDPALKAARRAIQIDPDNYHMQLLALRLEQKKGASDKKIVAAAAKLLDQHPKDPHFEMILGLAYAMAGDNAKTRRWLTSAANRPIKNPQFARTLVHMLDAVGLWQQSRQVLSKTASAKNKAGIFKEMIQRQFEAGEYKKVVQRLGGLDRKSADVDLLALKALALLQLQRGDQAQAITAALARRSDAPTGPLWASVLRPLQTGQTTRLINACKQSLQTMPRNPYVHAMLAKAYASVGDAELAISQWKKTAKLRPSWSGIRQVLADHLLAAGDTDQAIGYARQALGRQPTSVNAALTLARALVRKGPGHSSVSTKGLVDLIDQIQQAVPHQPQVLLLKAAALAQDQQRQAALGVIDRLLSRDKLSQKILMQTTALNRQYKLGLADRLSRRIQKDLSGTPQLALARARELASQGKPKQGLAQLQAAAKAHAGNKRVEAPWRFAITSYLGSIHSPRAAQAWKSLADDYPKNAKLQRSALHARAVRGDRKFADRVITRLEKLMGQDSVVARLARARWLLTSPKVEQDVPRAVEMLRRISAQTAKRVEPRLLLARGLERLGKNAVAIRALQAADQAIPNSPAILLELAQLQQRVRLFSSARDSLEQVASNADASAGQRRRAAALLARQGDAAAAIQVMENLRENGKATSSQDLLLLASLYARNGEADKTDALLKTLLKNPTPQVIAFALSHYASQGASGRVRDMLARLKKMDMPDAARDAVLADYHAKTGDLGKAAKLYQASLNQAPRDASRWHKLVRFQLMRGKVDAALAAAKQGLSHLPHDQGLQAVRQHATLIRRQSDKQAMRPMLAALLAKPARRRLALQALQLAAPLTGNDPSAARKVVGRLSDLAEAHQNFQALQNLAALAYLRTKKFGRAAQVASRTARNFPTAVEPAWLHAQALAQAGQWSDALGAALQWRQRTAGSTRDADLMIAQAKLKLGDATGAMRQLVPYAKKAKAQPSQYPLVIQRIAGILVAQQRYDAAGQVLLPLLDKASHWRVTAMSLAANNIDDGRVAADWLTQAGRAIPSDALDERTVLAQSWWTLAQRVGSQADAARARSVMDEVTAHPQAGASAWYMKGVMAEQDENDAVAEAAYRKAIQHDAKMAAAQNNLAMVLVRRGNHMAEALRLAREAVNTSSANVSFLDTLATVQAKAKKCDQAVATMHQAIKLDRNNPKWREHLANILKACGRKDEARRVLNQLAAQGAGGL